MTYMVLFYSDSCRKWKDGGREVGQCCSGALVSLVTRNRVFVARRGVTYGCTCITPSVELQHSIFVSHVTRTSTRRTVPTVHRPTKIPTTHDQCDNRGTGSPSLHTNAYPAHRVRSHDKTEEPNLSNATKPSPLSVPKRLTRQRGGNDIDIDIVKERPRVP